MHSSAMSKAPARALGSSSRRPKDVFKRKNEGRCYRDWSLWINLVWMTQKVTYELEWQGVFKEVGAIVSS